MRLYGNKATHEIKDLVRNIFCPVAFLKQEKYFTRINIQIKNLN